MVKSSQPDPQQDKYFTDWADVPQGYNPTFPDKTVFPAVFPKLLPGSGPGGTRPHPAPKHPSGAVPPIIPKELVPRHVAVVMDGNGRWARARGLPRTEGHKMGEATMMDMVCGAIEMGIPWLTTYAFSTENWRRPADEVRFLMGFNRDVVKRRRHDLNNMGVRFRWAGQKTRLWSSVYKELEITEELTKNNSTLTLTTCINYGGRAEIAEATRRIARLVESGQLKPDRITEETIAKYLDEPDMPDVDLFLRPSGEFRSSNFMMWQSAYAEFVFQEKMYPDFDRRDLWAACLEYAQRDRRFGSA
ncbi:isoprenyl transferase [Mycobacteroides franklinii]|uniref:Isoprenyl transferase n=1 Tax=Mycobacteroides franklinii TaxID=948102 RepID=A0A4R5P8V3_9MYCO|nr:isoprenyl transferase [Mycobacteroides franklinii]TDH19567.1 isoprenyl transferase [Mycobacteroides franklinii]